MDSRPCQQMPDSPGDNILSTKDGSYPLLDQSSPDNDSYYRMDCRLTPRTRSWTVQSGLSDFSFMSEEEVRTDGDGLPSRFMEMGKMHESSVSPPEYSSLPAKLSYQCPAQLSRQNVTRVRSDRGKLSNNPNYLSEASTHRRMIRTSQSISCLPSEPEPASPLLMFLPKILRSSLSKIMSNRSKSPVQNDNPVEHDRLSPSPSERDLISPLTEEIVSESLEKGLPIIPFAFPMFHGANTSVEENKQSARKNSVKSLKIAFCENKRKNRNIYPEEEEISEALTKSKLCLEKSAEDYLNNSEIDQQNKDVQRKKRHDSFVSQSSSSYVEMSPGEAYPMIGSHITKNNFGEDPYMHMNEVRIGEKKSSQELSRKLSEDQMFYLEQGSPVQRKVKNKIPENVNKSKRGSLFSMGEGTMSMDRGLSRLHRKGNKHKEDYVFVDFEKNNYVDMQQLGGKKWKFLTLSKT